MLPLEGGLLCSHHTMTAGTFQQPAALLQGEEHPEHCKSISKAHAGAVVTLQRSPFFDDILLSTGDWSWALWQEGRHDVCLFQSPLAAAQYTAGCWSPTRPGDSQPLGAWWDCICNAASKHSKGRWSPAGTVWSRRCLLAAECWACLLPPLAEVCRPALIVIHLPGCHPWAEPIGCCALCSLSRLPFWLTRPFAGVLYLGRADGVLEVWDLLDRSHEPSMTANPTSSAITSLSFSPAGAPAAPGGRAVQQLLAVGEPRAPPAPRCLPGAVGSLSTLHVGSLPRRCCHGVHSGSCLSAAGDSTGVLHVMDLPRTLRRRVTNEVKTVTTFMQREQQRLEYLASRKPIRAEAAKVIPCTQEGNVTAQQAVLTTGRRQADASKLNSMQSCG